MSSATQKNKNDFDQNIRWIINEKYKGRANKVTRNDTTRLKRGEPVDYVIGFSDFLGCKIDLSKRPLIPRPETEFWVEKAIKDIKKSASPKKCLDVFSGSGCIGIAVLKNVLNSTMDFVDSEKKMIEQITLNCEINKISRTRRKIIKSDLFEKLSGAYDYIFANPPYISENTKGEVEKSVLLYEPQSALFGGNDGLYYVEKFLSQISKHLNKGGKLYMEFGSDQKPAILKIIKKCGFSETEFYKDQFGKWRFLLATI